MKIQPIREGFYSEDGETHLKYSVTNESLPAIVNGLNVNENDLVLAILSSGDQTFALAESGCHVKAIDKSIAQIEYAQRRLGALKLSKIYPDELFYFLKIQYLGERDGIDRTSGRLSEREIQKIAEMNRGIRNGYFSPERIDRIRDNAENIEIVDIPHDIFEMGIRTGGVTKVYLSNVLDCSRKELRAFEDMARRLNQGSLIYVTNGEKVERSLGNELGIRDILKAIGLSGKESLRDILEVDEVQTGIAREHEVQTSIAREHEAERGIWKPIVYRRK